MSIPWTWCIRCNGCAVPVPETICERCITLGRKFQAVVIAREIRRQHRHDWIKSPIPRLLMRGWKTRTQGKYITSDPIFDQARSIICRCTYYLIPEMIPDFLPDELAAIESKWHPLPHDVKE